MTIATYIVPAPPTPYTHATLPSSAHRETGWARALRELLVRHGGTPIHDALVAEFEAPTTCAQTWGHFVGHVPPFVSHTHGCHHPDGHPGRHVCRCRSWRA